MYMHAGEQFTNALFNVVFIIQDLAEYKKKHRPLRVILLDESQRTVLIDDSQAVGQIIKVVCARINLSNPDEFSLTGTVILLVHVEAWSWLLSTASS